MAIPAQRSAAPAAESVVERPARRAPRRDPERTSASVTIRLDPDRHLSLRLLAAIENRSARGLLLEALDRTLSEMPGLEELAETVRKPVAA